MSVQVIEKNGRPEWAVIPYREYQRLQESCQDAEDIRDIEHHLKALQSGKETAIPGEITFAILEGANPIRAWRKYKKLKVKELAKKVRISAAHLSQIENNKRTPSTKNLKDIAQALEVEREALT